MASEGRTENRYTQRENMSSFLFLLLISEIMNAAKVTAGFCTAPAEKSSFQAFYTGSMSSSSTSDCSSSRNAAWVPITTSVAPDTTKDNGNRFTKWKKYHSNIDLWRVCTTWLWKGAHLKPRRLQLQLQPTRTQGEKRLQPDSSGAGQSALCLQCGK